MIKKKIDRLKYLNKCHWEFLVNYGPDIIYGTMIVSQILFNEFVIETLELFSE